MTIDNTTIANYVQGILHDSSMTPQQQAATIASAMASNGVSADQVAEATGFDVGAVSNFLGAATTTAPTAPAAPAAPAITNQQITDYAASVLNDHTLSYPQQTAKIADAMKTNNVSADQIAAATGWNTSAVTDWLAGKIADPINPEGRDIIKPVAPTGPATNTTTTPTTPTTPVVPTTPTTPTTSVNTGTNNTTTVNPGTNTAPNQAMNDVIKNYISSVMNNPGLTYAQQIAKIQGAMATNQVTPDQISAATGWNTQSVNDWLAGKIPNPSNPTGQTIITPKSGPTQGGGVYTPDVNAPEAEKNGPFTNGLVNPGLNPGMVQVTPAYQTTSPVQSQYYWGQHPYQISASDNSSYNNTPAAPITPWGIQSAPRVASYDAMGRPVYAPASTPASQVASGPGTLKQQLETAWKGNDFNTVQNLVNANNMTTNQAQSVWGFSPQDFALAAAHGVGFVQPVKPAPVVPTVTTPAAGGSTDSGAP